MVFNRIKELRKKKHLTQKELAKLVGLDYTHIGRIENGDRTLDVEYLEKFAIALGVKPYELLPLEWQPAPISEKEQQILDIVRESENPKSCTIQLIDLTLKIFSLAYTRA